MYFCCLVDAYQSLGGTCCLLLQFTEDGYSIFLRNQKLNIHQCEILRSCTLEHVKKIRSEGLKQKLWEISCVLYRVYWMSTYVCVCVMNTFHVFTYSVISDISWWPGSSNHLITVQRELCQSYPMNCPVLLPHFMGCMCLWMKLPWKGK